MPPYNNFFDSCNFQVMPLFKKIHEFENLMCKLQTEEYVKNIETYFHLLEKNSKLCEKKLLKNE